MTYYSIIYDKYLHLTSIGHTLWTFPDTCHQTLVEIWRRWMWLKGTWPWPCCSQRDTKEQLPCTAGEWERARERKNVLMNLMSNSSGMQTPWDNVHLCVPSVNQWWTCWSFCVLGTTWTPQTMCLSYFPKITTSLNSSPALWLALLKLSLLRLNLNEVTTESPQTCLW